MHQNRLLLQFRRTSVPNPAVLTPSCPPSRPSGTEHFCIETKANLVPGYPGGKLPQESNDLLSLEPQDWKAHEELVTSYLYSEISYLQKKRQGSRARKEEVGLKQRGLQQSPGETRHSVLILVAKPSHGVRLRGQSIRRHSRCGVRLGCHLQHSGVPVTSG